MKIYSNTITKSQLEAIASDLDIKLHNADHNFAGARSRRINLTLRPTADTWQSHSGTRRVWAVSWEGHYVFMRAIFQLDPNAKIASSVATYDGVEQFEEFAWYTGDRNVGSIAYPISARSAQVNECHNEDELNHIAYLTASVAYSPVAA